IDSRDHRLSADAMGGGRRLPDPGYRNDAAEDSRDALRRHRRYPRRQVERGASRRWRDGAAATRPADDDGELVLQAPAITVVTLLAVASGSPTRARRSPKRPR